MEMTLGHKQKGKEIKKEPHPYPLTPLDSDPPIGDLS